MTAVHEAEQRATALQEEIWRQAVSACQASPGWRPDQLVLLPLNDMIDITTMRTVAAQTHPPAIVYLTPDRAGSGRGTACRIRHGGTALASRFHAVAFALVLMCTVYVILELEFPRWGLVRDRRRGPTPGGRPQQPALNPRSLMKWIHDLPQNVLALTWQDGCPVLSVAPLWEAGPQGRPSSAASRDKIDEGAEHGAMTEASTGSVPRRTHRCSPSRVADSGRGTVTPAGTLSSGVSCLPPVSLGRRTHQY